MLAIVKLERSLMVYKGRQFHFIADVPGKNSWSLICNALLSINSDNEVMCSYKPLVEDALEELFEVDRSFRGFCGGSQGYITVLGRLERNGKDRNI